MAKDMQSRSFEHKGQWYEITVEDVGGGPLVLRYHIKKKIEGSGNEVAADEFDITCQGWPYGIANLETKSLIEAFFSTVEMTIKTQV